MSNTLSGGPCLLDSLRVILLLGMKTCNVRICLHWVFKFISWSAVLCLVLSAVLSTGSLQLSAVLSTGRCAMLSCSVMSNSLQPHGL